MEKNQTDYTILFFIFGLVLTWTPIVTPIHEIGHLIAAVLAGGGGHFIAFNEVSVEYYMMWDGFVSSMGQGFVAICGTLGFIAAKRHRYAGAMLKAGMISLTIEFITLTDYSGEAFVWLLGILGVCWFVAFRPFKKKQGEETRQDRSPVIR